MLPQVLDSDASHPTTAINRLSRTELHQHLHIPPTASCAALQEGCFADGCNRTQETSIHPCSAESMQDRRLLEAQRSPLVLTHHSEAFWGNAGLGRNQLFSLLSKPFSHTEAVCKSRETHSSPQPALRPQVPLSGQRCSGVLVFGAWIQPPSAQPSSIPWKPYSL